MPLTKHMRGILAVLAADGKFGTMAPNRADLAVVYLQVPVCTKLWAQTLLDLQTQVLMFGTRGVGHTKARAGRAQQRNVTG